MSENSLANRIVQARELANLSEEEVCRLVGVKPETYHHWESGSSEPRINKLTTLAGVLAVTPGWLLSGDDDHLNSVDDNEQIALFRLRIEQLSSLQSRVQVMLDELSCDLDDFTGADADADASEDDLAENQ